MVKKQPSLIDACVDECAVNTVASTPAIDPAVKFEAALRELETIVHEMENGDLPLEESIAAYRRGNLLVQHCRLQLTDAEQKIQILEEGSLRDFAPTERRSS